MKKNLLLYLFVVLAITILAPRTTFSQQVAQSNKPQSMQDLISSAYQDMQKSDPQSAQAFMNAVQKGDVSGAKKIYKDFQDKQTSQLTSTPTATNQQPTPPQTSSLEQTLSGKSTEVQTAPMVQFGYDLFDKQTSPFMPPATIPVGPDYMIGPGDQFTLTLWGTTEGIFTLQVTNEGNITLPKVGVVAVAGLRFGQLEKTLRRHLAAYYRDVNLSVAMGNLRTMTVYVVGQVQNPGSYPVPSLTTVYGALFAAGGPTKTGTMRNIQVLRNGKVIRTIDLYDFLMRGDRSQDMKLQSEDTVFVPLIGPVVGVAGDVARPAIYEVKGEKTVADLLQTAGNILPTAFSGRIELDRFVDNQQQVLFDIKIPAFSGEALKQVPELKGKVSNMDVIKVFTMYGDVWETVNLGGAVKYPGQYQWRPGLRVKDIIQLGQLLPTSDLRAGEVIRMSGDFRSRVVLPVDIEALMKGDEAQDIKLQPKDLVRVYTKLRKPELVGLSGEVMRPGMFEITQGERLSDLLRRAGGFTPNAYPYGAVFKRPEIKTFQAKQLNAFVVTMQERLLQTAAESQAAAVSTEEAGIQKAQAAVTQQLLANLKAQQDLAQGRVALNITTDIDSWAGTKEDPILQDGDSFSVPKIPQEVSVIGEVYNPGAVTYLDGMSVKDYIALTGGFTKYSNKNDVFVLQANGFAVSKQSSQGDLEKMKLRPGDAIMVPQEVERHAAMRNFNDIIDILFKTAVIVATLAVLHL